MSMEQFKPTVWSAKLMSELDKNLVAAEDCTREYEGELKEAGDSVTIVGVNTPTINSSSDGKAVTLSGAERPKDTSIKMPIMEQRWFDFAVDNIDKAQAVNGVMTKLTTLASRGLADAVDTHILGMANAPLAPLDASTSYQLTDSNVFEKIDSALETLYQNNVKIDDNISITIPPWVYNKIKLATIKLDTDNSQKLEKGLVGYYSGVKIKMSNNVYDDGTHYKIMVRTPQAVAYVNQVTTIQAYKPDNSFADAVKGLMVFDAKIIAPKQLVVMHIKK